MSAEKNLESGSVLTVCVLSSVVDSGCDLSCFRRLV